MSENDKTCLVSFFFYHNGNLLVNCNVNNDGCLFASTAVNYIWGRNSSDMP